jgi:predicted  nucleic acid-binding Zn-ribbon protein
VDYRDMAKPDWLSIEEISRLWGEETGLDASAFQKDLEQWFAKFVRQTPASQALITGKNTDTTNLLMGMLGARYLERPTFEAYCEERGYPMPRFWLGGRVEGSPRDTPSQSEPAATPPEATPPQPSEERSYVRRASNPELEAFQTQIASMSERLKASSFEVPSDSKPSAADQMDLGSDSRRTGPSAEQIQQELIERAEAASAEARQLKTRLESAEQRLTDLTAETAASRASSLAWPSAPGPASPNAAQYEPATGIPTGQQASANYRDPSATGQLLRQTTARRKGRGRIILATGLAVPLVALLYWGAETVIQPTGTEPTPPTAETANTMAGPGSTVGGNPPAQPDTAALSPEPATEKLDLGGAVLQADARDLAAARHQIARLTASAQASNSLVARLRDELAIARQAGETARQKPTAETNPKAETQQRELALAANAEASNLRGALAGAEQKLAALGAQLDAALGTAADADTRTAGARAETAHLQTENIRLTQELAEAITGATSFREALRQAKDQTDTKRQDLTLAATVSSARVADLQRELNSAHQQVTKLSRVRVAAKADASGLRTSLQQAEEQTDSIRQELTLAVTASSARLSTLQKELRTAQQRIADLSKAAEAAEDEAAKLREEMAARQQEAAATRPSTTQPVETTEPGLKQHAVEETAEPEIEELLTAAESSSNPVSGDFEQVAALAPSEVALQTDAVPDTVSLDDLLLEPGSHLGREVVVTGSVVWLLWRYRLQSDSGPDSMVIDVEGLRPADQKELKNAVDRVGALAQVHARIRGTIVRQGEESYRLAASELVLVE